MNAAAGDFRHKGNVLKKKDLWQGERRRPAGEEAGAHRRRPEKDCKGGSRRSQNMINGRSTAQLTQGRPIKWKGEGAMFPGIREGRAASAQASDPLKDPLAV